MPPASQRLKKQRERLGNNLQRLGGAAKTCAKRVLEHASPSKIVEHLSPKKKKQRLAKENRDPVIPVAEGHPDASDASSDPFSVSIACIVRAEVPSSAPKMAASTWKLPKPRRRVEIEQIPDEDDRMSICTFPIPGSLPPQLLFPSVDDLGFWQDVGPQATSSRASPPPPEEDFDDNLFDEIQVPEDEDELLARPPAAGFHNDEYPRPRAPPSFVAHMAEHARRDGKVREAPSLGEAKLAFIDIEKLIRGELRGTALFGRSGVGYKRPAFDVFMTHRLNGMRALLNNYSSPESLTHGHWGKSAKMAAVGLGRSTYCARVLCQITREYILDRTVLPVNPYGDWNKSMMADEDLRNDLLMDLQALGESITADKVLAFLRDPAVRLKHGINREVTHKTACRYLDELGYRFSAPKKGQYVDGHERADVVYYRDNVYLPRLFKLYERVWVFDNDGNHHETDHPLDSQRRVIIWYHDESVFYAHDRRRKEWYHKDAPARPYRKGDGVSYMVADFFSPDFGWLRHPHTGASARRAIRPGKNRDGYFTAVEVQEQAEAAMAIIKDTWPDYDHVFVYDNATTHKKRSEGALSARKMPKFPSGTRGKQGSNFLVEVNRRDADGKLVYNSHGNIVKDAVQMTGAQFSDGTPQDLYFPAGHAHAGKFKGMQQILHERNLLQYVNLPAECTNFKCADPGENSTCCMRRVLFNQPDFAAVKSMLEETCVAGGVEVLFLPKFHCELNPIEMVWGYAKRVYRLNPESSREDVLEKNSLAALEAVPILSMRRYVNRVYRFADGYFNKKLTGPQVAWASKKYHGHRVFPECIFDDLTGQGL